MSLNVTSSATATAGIGFAHYRPDIDGLRAVAVGAVILYHYKLGAPGGFVGVDVFFVISGYLISAIVFSKISLFMIEKQAIDEFLVGAVSAGIKRQQFRRSCSRRKPAIGEDAVHDSIAVSKFPA